MLNLRSLAHWRPLPVYFMAAALPLSMAATSISKLLLALTGLAIVLQAIARRETLPSLYQLSSVKLVFLMLGLLALSAAYTDATALQALGDWGKYAKLILIPLTVILLRTPAHCRAALVLLLASQTFVLLSSCALGLGWTLPWVQADRNGATTVFTTYLDQAVMTAGYAALCWHFRSSVSNRWLTWTATGLALLAFFNVIFLLKGRSGHVAMLVVAALAVGWALPRKWRWMMFAAPLLAGLLALTTGSEFQDRMRLGLAETIDYAQRDDKSTSIGLRLNFWHRSVQAIAERPLTGYGVGSWRQQFLRLEGPGASLGNSPRSNPHQEFLQWGVQLGLPGIALVVALMVCLLRDARAFDRPARLAMQSVVAVFTVACLFNSALFDALIGDYFCLTLGLMLACGRVGLRDVQQPGVAMPSVIGGAA